MSKPANLKEVDSEEAFNKEMADAGDKLVVVDYYATWCGPCKMISPKLSKLAEQFPIIVLKVDVDELPSVAETAGVTAMPTFQFYKNGAKVDELIGASEQKLKEKIEKNIC